MFGLRGSHGALIDLLQKKNVVFLGEKLSIFDK